MGKISSSTFYANKEHFDSRLIEALSQRDREIIWLCAGTCNGPRVSRKVWICAGMICAERQGISNKKYRNPMTILLKMCNISGTTPGFT